jgi:predicted esterase
MIHAACLFAIASILAGPPAQNGSESKPVGKIESCNFATRSLPAAYQAPKRFADGYKLFQSTASVLPEGMIVKSVVAMGQPQIGLTTKETQGLYANLDRVYASISADPLFREVRSVLPMCLSEKRATQGHYFAYYPPKIGDDTQAIVFLHGFGGNFLFYIYLLKEEFPNAVILVPSFGVSWHDGTMQYLDDMYKDVKQQHSFAVRKPCLMAISAGGPAGFWIYNQHPDRFSCLASLASSPSPGVVPKLKDDLKILMINGRTDSGFPIAKVQSTADKIAARLPHYQFHIVDGDHFFLLSKREETFKTIKTFLDKK